MSVLKLTPRNADKVSMVHRADRTGQGNASSRVILTPVYPFLGPIPTHGLFVGLGVLAAAVVFVLEARRRGARDERLVFVVMGALVGGAILMRMGTWLQHVDLRENASITEQWLYGNRSILGGLFGAWAGVHVAKRLTG